MMLFCDGSVHTQSGVGFGAYLLALENAKLPPDNPSIKVACFKDTSSTRLEIETLLWALSEMDEKIPLKIFTDSQNIVGLAVRRAKLEKQNFCSKKGVPLKNKALYETFFRYLDRLPIEIHKIKGHNKKSLRTPLQATFSLVDRASRSYLRKYLESAQADTQTSLS